MKLRDRGLGALTLAIVATGGCSAAQVVNEPLDTCSPDYGYRTSNHAAHRDPGRIRIALTLSGGGTRGASVIINETCTNSLFGLPCADAAAGLSADSVRRRDLVAVARTLSFVHVVGARTGEAAGVSIQERVKIVDVLTITTEPPLIVDHTTSVSAAIEQMCDGRTGCALVTRDGKLVGLFTERDVLNKVLGEADALEQPVSAVMTPDPVRLTEDAPIREAVVQMHRGGFRNVPVVDSSDAPVGCIRHKDVITYLVENFADRTLNVPPDPDQIATKPEGA